MGMVHSKAGQTASLESVRGSSLKGCSPALKKKKYIYIYLFIYLFLAVLGLRCCVGFSLAAESRGWLLSSCSALASH